MMTSEPALIYAVCQMSKDGPYEIAQFTFIGDARVFATTISGTWRNSLISVVLRLRDRKIIATYQHGEVIKNLTD